jgi:hypothetical protein
MRSMRSQKFTWKDENVPSDASIRRLKSLLAAVNALKQASIYTNIQKAFERSGIYPRDVNAALQNPRLNQSLILEETPLLIETTPQRKKLSITSQLITKDSVIDAIKARDEEKKRKFDEKNQYEISNLFLGKRKQRNARPQRRNRSWTLSLLISHPIRANHPLVFGHLKNFKQIYFPMEPLLLRWIKKKSKINQGIDSFFSFTSLFIPMWWGIDLLSENS